MSGPTYISLTGDYLNGPVINQLLINGISGTMELRVTPHVDSDVFDLYIGGKLRIKNKVCGIKDAPSPRGKQVQRIVPVCNKVKP